MTRTWFYDTKTDSGNSITVEYSITGGFAGTYFEPPEPPEITILKVLVEEKGDFEPNYLDDEEYTRIENEIYESILKHGDPREDDDYD